jgi:hypothetical protein
VAGGTPITVKGDNFVVGTRVSIGGTAAPTSVNVTSSTELQTTAPPGAKVGPADVKVETPAGSDTLAGGYYYTP